MSEGEISFIIRFRPKVGWADKVYLGNMLMELLGVMAKNTNAFDFKVEEVKEGEGQRVGE